MYKHKKIIDPINRILIYSLLANAIIIAAASIYTPDLFWLLLLIIPLLLAGIFYVKQRKLLPGSVWHNWSAGDKKTKKQEWLPHSIYPDKLQKNDWKVLIGNDQCSQPYSAHIFNIAAIKNTHPEKFSGQQIIDKNVDGFNNSCGERLCTYCLTGEDLVLQIKPNYASCRTAHNNTNSKVFQENAYRSEVKMIELVLTTGMKSLRKINPSSDVGDVFDAKTDVRTLSNSSYSASIDAEGMIHFLGSLRELSGRKPIGIRLSINDKKKFFEICYAIRKTHLIPDFIVVEGSSNNATAILDEKDTHAIMPLYETLLFVSQTLQIYRLEKEIKIIASGEIKSCFDILKILTLGASAVCTDPSGYSLHGRKSFYFYKDQDITDFHENIMKTIVHAMYVCGCKNVSEITLSKFFRRLDALHSNGFETLNVPVLPFTEHAS